MKNLLKSLILLTIVFQLLFTTAGKAQGIDTEKVTLGLKSESLETAIKKIEALTSFRFFYHDMDVRPLAHLNLTPGTRTIEQTLDELLQNTTLYYRQIDGNILLERKRQQVSFEITGRVVDSLGKKPVANASVFLSKTIVGAKTADDGVFTLQNIKPGKYDLVVSIIGYGTYIQTTTVSSSNITLPDIIISPKTIALKEVTVKPLTDAAREKDYELFKAEFVGTSELANECKILNPEILDLDYDEKGHILTASSPDFLEIENAALGYKIKYLLANFKLDYSALAKFRLDYKGSVLFEEMKGTPAQQKRWQKRRRQVYEGSVMHFLRAALNDSIGLEGFRVLRLERYENPERPADSLIEAKIESCKRSETAGRRDSLSFWTKKARLPKLIEKLTPIPLSKNDIITPQNKQGLFALGPGSDDEALYVTYNKNRHFYINIQATYVDNPNNSETSIINFIAPYAFFDRNGWLEPNSVAFTGVWGRNRVADLLPIDYETKEMAGQGIKNISNQP